MFITGAHFSKTPQYGAFCFGARLVSDCFFVHYFKA